jgi:type VI protein secretion system component VasF
VVSPARNGADEYVSPLFLFLFPWVFVLVLALILVLLLMGVLMRLPSAFPSVSPHFLLLPVVEHYPSQPVLVGGWGRC